MWGTPGNWRRVCEAKRNAPSHLRQAPFLAPNPKAHSFFSPGPPHHRPFDRISLRAPGSGAEIHRNRAGRRRAGLQPTTAPSSPARPGIWRRPDRVSLVGSLQGPTRFPLGGGNDRVLAGGNDRVLAGWNDGLSSAIVGVSFSPAASARASLATGDPSSPGHRRRWAPGPAPHRRY